MNKNKKSLRTVQRILKQAIEITSNSESDVFVNYSGHVDCIEIKVYLQGWKPENEVDYKKEIWFNIYDEECCQKQLEEVFEYLKNIKF